VQSTFKRDWALTTSAAVEVNRLARTWQPNLVHAHAAMPGVVARHAGLGTDRGRAPIVHTMHGWGVTKTAAQASEDLQTLQRADAVAAPSTAAARTLRELGVSRDVNVIPYGIDLDEGDTPPDDSDLTVIRSQANGPIALCIGTVGARKNQALLVDALTLPALQDFRAVFIGDGNTAPLVTRARQNGVADRVIVLGHRPRASRYLSVANALVLPSRNEGLPIAILEAMRAGVPVVATDLPEIREALGAEHSEYLVQPDDAAALGHALLLACRRRDDPRRRASLQRRFATHFSTTRMETLYESWYTSALRS
jgi:glycosyltransferase involved in cell wall biosynthesis